MHRQYLITRDIKFPDQKQYAKPGDLIMFNDTTSSLAIYRGASLVGTVKFSSAGLNEFIRLGWITETVSMQAEPKTKSKETPSDAPAAEPRKRKK